MILAVNLNASQDKRYALERLEKGTVMRARRVDNTPGGKGVHVANVLTILGEDCVATGFLGGRTGAWIARQLARRGIRGDFVEIAQETRCCLAILTDDGAQTELLEPGPEIAPAELARFAEKYASLAADAAVIVASGSVPRAVFAGIYRELGETARRLGKRFFLDASGDALREGLAARPYFIKPNRDEIEALTGRRVRTVADAVAELRRFAAAGIAMAAVSLGEAGSVLGCADGFYRADVPSIRAVNAVGSGDAYVAGMAAAIARGDAPADALRFATACGAANALEEESGFVRREIVAELLNRVAVEKL